MANRILSALIASSLALSALASPMPKVSNNSGAIPLLRLKMVLDSFNYDDIAIGFLESATTNYNSQIDSRYLPGIDAPEGLFSFSSDNVPLTVNILPLPQNSAMVIRLGIESKNSGSFVLERTELDSIPAAYDIWLMDKYTRDSLDLRSNNRYAFTVNKSDTATFGSSRFSVVIRPKAALAVRLLGFRLSKTAAGNQLEWTTENEQNNTSFFVERSIDEGKTFVELDSLMSTGSGAYSYTDGNPGSGTNQYRVKMAGANGVIIYSNIISAGDDPQPLKNDNALNIYPNPSNGPINLTINQPAGSNASSSGALQASAVSVKATSGTTGKSSFSIKIVNINGIVIRSATASGATWQDNLATLPPGTYFVQVVDNSDKKLVGKSTFIKL